MKTVQTCAECGDWYTIDLPGERRRPRLCLGCTTPAAVGRVKAADIVRATEIAMDINAAAAAIEHEIDRLAAVADRCESMPALRARVESARKCAADAAWKARSAGAYAQPKASK